MLGEEEGGRHTPFETGYAPQIFLRTASLTGTIKLPKDVVGMPGKDVSMEFETIWPVAVHEGQKFSIREGGKYLLCYVSVVELAFLVTNDLSRRYDCCRRFDHQGVER